MSLAKIREPPERALILLAGPPGAGKPTFCHQVVLNSVAAGRPVVLVITERNVPDIISLLSGKGLGESTPEALGFADAFATTAGLAIPERLDSVGTNCQDFNSINVATTKPQTTVAAQRKT